MAYCTCKYHRLEVDCVDSVWFDEGKGIHGLCREDLEDTITNEDVLYDCLGNDVRRSAAHNDEVGGRDLALEAHAKWSEGYIGFVTSILSSDDKLSVSVAAVWRCRPVSLHCDLNCGISLHLNCASYVCGCRASVLHSECRNAETRLSNEFYGILN
jgi:hypothetical protein